MQEKIGCVSDPNIEHIMIFMVLIGNVGQGQMLGNIDIIYNGTRYYSITFVIFLEVFKIIIKISLTITVISSYVYT